MTIADEYEKIAAQVPPEIDDEILTDEEIEKWMKQYKAARSVGILNEGDLLKIAKLVVVESRAKDARS